MLIFYIASVPGIPVADQESSLRKLDWTPEYAATYRESKNGYPKEARKAIGACRKGARDQVCVSELAIIVPRRKYLKGIRALLKKHGACIIESSTGLRSDRPADYGQMLEKVFERWSRKWLTPSWAKKIGEVGGKRKGKSFRDRRLPKGDAMLIWHDKSLTEEEAIDKINGVEGYDIPWSRSACFRHLGKRGMPIGPRAKK